MKVVDYSTHKDKYLEVLDKNKISISEDLNRLKTLEKKGKMLKGSKVPKP
jgi:hypothetical protein